MTKNTRWMDCKNCEGYGRVDVDPVNSIRTRDCTVCNGDGEQRSQLPWSEEEIADCYAVYRDRDGKLRECYMAWSDFDELADDGKIVALEEWRDEPARMMDGFSKRATVAKWNIGGQWIEGSRGSGGAIALATASNTVEEYSARDAFKIAALIQRAATFASQEVAEEETQPAAQEGAR